MAGCGRLEKDDLVRDLQIWHYQISGFWRIVNYYRETGRKSRVFKMWVVCTIIGFTPLFVLSVVGVFFTEKTLKGITLTVLMPLGSIQMGVNLWVIWNGLEIQAQLMELMRRNYLESVPPSKTAEVQRIIDDSVKRSNFVVNVILVINCFTAGVWDSLPILRSEYFRNTLGITIFGTPDGPNKLMEFWYPFNQNDTPWAQIIFVYEFCILGWAGFMITLLELLFVQLVLMLICYLKIIRFLVSEVKHTSDVGDPNEALLLYIKEHQKLIRASDDVGKLYNFMVTMQLITGFFIMTLAPFNLILGTRNGQVDSVFKFVTYTLYSLLEVYIFSAIGTELETTSEDVCFAAYSSDWYLLDVQYRKKLLLMMTRSQSALSVKAGRLYPVNVTVLKNILQTAYSTTALLYNEVTGD